MHFLDLTLPTPAENLALDEALLAACEAGEISAGGVLRIWEPSGYFVVLGRSSDPTIEVNLAACRARGIPVLRRASGGGAILTGPGCLMYALVIGLANNPELKSITRAHQFVLNTHATALASHVPNIACAGTSDLTFSGENESLWKFSGNALRMKRNFFLYHGTLLYDFNLELVTELLARATREPLYRSQRTHREFIANLPIEREQLVTALVDGWNATERLVDWPVELTGKIANEKYGGIAPWVFA